MASLRRCLTSLLLVSALHLAPAGAQARFDLAGPKIDIRVTRAGVTLPIAQVPNLEPGDQLWLHPALPSTQSVHYLLIAAFLRGTTNPPPDNWFLRIETWNKKVREEGAFVTVPPEAQQAVLFLAPETGGDFSTLRSAVRGRPGIFVRASQDLAEAGFEQARIDKYLASMKLVPPGDADALQNHSNLLARTLNLKPNPDCFKHPLDQQYTCLTQTGSQTLLDDGHGQTMVAALSNGPGSDFINQASYTQLAGAGSYSAYVGAIVDLVRILNGIHTAQFQYIPAIAAPEAESLNLRLNTPPSFHNPKSVIVIGLPAIQPVSLPPLRPAAPNHISCLLDPAMVLPIEGAPLFFSTAFAHNLILHLNTPQASGQDLPLLPDAYQGGLILARASPRHELSSIFLPASTPPQTAAAKPVAPIASSTPGLPVTGTIRGLWGFDPFTGPTLPLQQLPGTGWRILTSATNLIAGQPNHLQLTSTGTACIRSIALQPGETKVVWKLDKPPDSATASSTTAGSSNELLPPIPAVDLTLNLQQAAAPGSIRLAILQFGQKEPDQLGTRTFAEPARIETLRFHAGDLTATLTGNSLDQVQSLTLKDLTLTPIPTSPADSTQALNSQTSSQTLPLTLPKDTKAPALKPNEKLTAQVHLQDGRTLDVSTLVLPPRPAVTLLSKRVTQTSTSAIQLAPGEDLPLGAQLVFFLKSKAPFPRSGRIEIAQLQTPETATDSVLRTTLSVAAGTLILQDTHTLLATFDPLKTFGPSTFGPFQLRAISTEGATNADPGDWLPLADIVRLPTLTALHCPADPALPCLLSGTSLYLIDSLSPDAAFTSPTRVPEGFVDTTLSIPHPNGPTFFLRLRDDPATLQQVTLPITPEAPALKQPGKQDVPAPGRASLIHPKSGSLR